MYCCENCKNLLKESEQKLCGECVRQREYEAEMDAKAAEAEAEQKARWEAEQAEQAEQIEQARAEHEVGFEPPPDY